MKQVRAYRYRIHPSGEQQKILERTFGCVRFVYNKLLEEKLEHHKLTGNMLRNTPAHLKHAFVWLKEVDSLALCNAQIHLEAAFKNFFRDPQKRGFPRFKSRKQNRQTYTTNCVNGNIRLEGNMLRLPKAGWVWLVLHRQIPADHTIKSVTINKSPSGKYHVSILCEYEHCVAPLEPNPEKVLGLDFSMKSLVVSSEGERADYPRFYRQSLEKLAREMRKLSKCQKGSQNREKQRKRVAILHEHIANQRKDFLHKLSAQIANAQDAVCVEDLDMKAMSSALHFGTSVHDNGWGTFLSMLEYKLADRGKALVRVGRMFPSSKKCSSCGAVRKTLTLSERTYICPECGHVMDRDINAARNIRTEGLRIISAS